MAKTETGTPRNFAKGNVVSPQSAKDNEVTTAGSMKVLGTVQAQKDRGRPPRNFSREVSIHRKKF